MERSSASRRNRLIHVRAGVGHKDVTYERSQSPKVNYHRTLSVYIIRETQYWERVRPSGWQGGAEGGVSTEGSGGFCSRGAVPCADCCDHNTSHAWVKIHRTEHHQEKSILPYASLKSKIKSLRTQSVPSWTMHSILAHRQKESKTGNRATTPMWVCVCVCVLCVPEPEKECKCHI